MNDLSNKIYGSLKVIAKAGCNKNRQAIYRTICACGKRFDVLGHNLKSGRTKTCGRCKIGARMVEIIEGIPQQVFLKPIKLSQTTINSLGGEEQAVKTLRKRFPGYDAIINSDTGVTLWKKNLTGGDLCGIIHKAKE